MPGRTARPEAPFPTLANAEGVAHWKHPMMNVSRRKQSKAAKPCLQSIDTCEPERLTWRCGIAKVRCKHEQHRDGNSKQVEQAAAVYARPSDSIGWERGYPICRPHSTTAIIAAATSSKTAQGRALSLLTARCKQRD